MQRVCAGLLACTVVMACHGQDTSRESRVLRLEAEASFGSVDGPLSFSTIEAVTLSPRAGDSLFVIQSGVAEVLLLRETGDSLATFGGRGDGPGEFRRPTTVAMLNDTIWIADSDGTLAHFNTAGAFLGEFRPQRQPFAADDRPPIFVALLADGTLLYRGLASATPIVTGAIEQTVLARVSRPGAVLNTVTPLSVRNSLFILNLDAGGILVGAHPASMADRLAVHPRGRWIAVAEADEAVPGHATILWLGAGGDTLRRSTVQSAAVRAEPARRAFVDRLTNDSIEGRDRAAIERVMAEWMPWPSHMPPVTEMFADDSGRLWLRTPDTAADSLRWLVLEENGEPLGTITLDGTIALKAARGEVVWGTTAGTEGQPLLVRYRLRT